MNKQKLIDYCDNRTESGENKAYYLSIQYFNKYWSENTSNPNQTDSYWEVSICGAVKDRIQYKPHCLNDISFVAELDSKFLITYGITEEKAIAELVKLIEGEK